jgi:hypothetical protein
MACVDASDTPAWAPSSTHLSMPAGGGHPNVGAGMLLGVDSNYGSELINHHLLHCCDRREMTFIPSRAG